MGHKFVSVTEDARAAFENAASEVESLHEEMQEWQERMEENDGLAATAKHEEVEEAATALETATEALNDIGEPTLVIIEGEQVTFGEVRPYGKRGTPRWMRLSQAQARLEAVREVVEKKAAGAGEDEADLLSELLDAIDSAISEAENVSFPGMY